MSDRRVIPGSIPDVPTFGDSKENRLPGIPLPSPSEYIDKSGASKGDIAPKRKRKSSKRRNRSLPNQSGVAEARRRADQLQAALILARNGPGQPGAFDISGQFGGAVNNQPFLDEVNNARIQQQQQRPA